MIAAKPTPTFWSLLWSKCLHLGQGGAYYDSRFLNFQKFVDQDNKIRKLTSKLAQQECVVACTLSLL